MSVAVAARSSVGVVAAQQQQGAPARAQQSHAAVASRRRSVLGLTALTWAAAAISAPAHAAENAGGVDSASSPLIQELLQRTEVKREQRKKERLDDYYKRNYGDYFAFQAGSAGPNDSNNQQRIRQWLQQNTDPLLPPIPSSTQQ